MKASTAKYLVYAGCNNEGQILQGQPYDGPLDSESVAEFARIALQGSIYAMSNTRWGLAELDWQNLDNASGDGASDEPIYLVQDMDTECRNDDCLESDCGCELDEYFVAVARNKSE